MNLKKYILLGLCFLLPKLVFADEAARFCKADAIVNIPTGNIIDMMYTNGVRASDDDARHTLQIIMEALRRSLPPDQFRNLNPLVVYNPTSGVLTDVGEALALKGFGESIDRQYWRWFYELDSPPNDWQEAVDTALTRRSINLITNLNGLASNISDYLTELFRGRPEIWVAHSEGNAYVNAAYNTLFVARDDLVQLAPSVSIVSVANPMSYVAGQMPGAEAYTTLVDDHVINLLRDTIRNLGLGDPLPLGGNVLNNILRPDEFPRDLSGHGFEKTYLAERGNKNSPSKTKIIQNLQQALIGVQFPPQVILDGALTATLLWGSIPDLDLHITDPDGAHVYYLNPQGSGALSNDDGDGYGPEQYAVSCTGIQAGTYHVNANYFGGPRFSSNAVVEIKAGAQTRAFPIVLESARGESGNDTPIPIADIVVEGDSIEGYTFSVVDSRPPEVIPSALFALGQDSNIWDVVKDILVQTTPQTVNVLTDFGTIPAGTVEAYVDLVCSNPVEISGNGAVLGICVPNAAKTFDRIQGITTFTLRATETPSADLTVKIDWE